MEKKKKEELLPIKGKREISWKYKKMKQTLSVY